MRHGPAFVRMSQVEEPPRVVVQPDLHLRLVEPEARELDDFPERGPVAREVPPDQRRLDRTADVQLDARGREQRNVPSVAAASGETKHSSVGMFIAILRPQ